MTTPAAITAAVTALQNAIAAASPLDDQSLIGLGPSINAAQALVTALDTQIAILAPSIDGISPVGLPPQIITQVQSLIDAGQMQAQLVTMRGYAGRVLDNLRNATG